MKGTLNQTLTNVDFAQLIEKARVAELSRDVEALGALLEPVWPNFEKKPDFDEVEVETRGELYRICGYFLSILGFSQHKKNYQERGKDLLTEAIDLFVESNMPHHVGRTKALLAMAYYHQGRIEETEIVLDEASAFYQNDQLHPVNLLLSVTKIGALIWRMDFQSAYQILQEVQIPMELCEDPFLLARYHNQAGIIYSRIGMFSESQSHYEKAIQSSNEINNPRYVGNNLNNVALAHMRQGNLDAAKQSISEAIAVFEDIDEKGWLAVAFDTKGQIHLACNEYENGLSAIDRSIGLFGEGEFYSALTDAMWVKVHLLLRADRKEEAMIVFSELSDIANKEIGEYAVQKYAREFAKIVHVKKGTDFFAEVQAFKRELLMESLVDAGADMNKAAVKLKTNRKELIQVVNREFPDIYLELGISPGIMSTAIH